MQPRRLRLPALFILTLGFMAAAPSYAQNAPVVHPWSSLTPAQRSLLGPFQSQWDSFPPRRQEHLLQREKDWESMPPERQQQIRNNIERWQQMTPEERQQAQQNQHLYETLPADKQQQLHDAFQRFQQLPPAQRDALRRQWQQQSPEQRQQWLRHLGPNSTLPGKHAFGMPGR